MQSKNGARWVLGAGSRWVAALVVGAVGCGSNDISSLDELSDAEGPAAVSEEALTGGWTNLSLRNGWTTASNSNVPAIGIVNGIVTFRGALNGTQATSNVAFCLTSPTYTQFRPTDAGYLTVRAAMGSEFTGTLALDFPFTPEIPPANHYCMAVYQDFHSGLGSGAKSRTSLEGVTFDKSYQTSTLLSLKPGWSSAYPERGSDGTINPAGQGAFAKVVSGFVRFQGVITGVQDASMTILKMPSGQGMIPGNSVFVPVTLCPTNPYPGVIQIKTNGDVAVISTSPEAAWCGVSLDGASYSMSNTGAQSISLSNGWVAYSSRAVRARVDGGAVRLEGAVKSGTTSTIGTLPSGMRPAKTIYVPAGTIVNGSPAMLSITSGGVVKVLAPVMFVASAGISLDGVSFGL